MENRDRDELNQSDGPTEAGDINRETSHKKGTESEESNSPRDRIEISRRTDSSYGWH